MCYDPRLCSTNILILGLTRRQIEALSSSIKASRSWEVDMLLIPMILVEQCVQIISERLSRERALLSEVEKETGMHNFHIKEIVTDPKEDPVLNLDNITKRLTIFSSEFAHIDLVCNTQLRFLDKISAWRELAHSPQGYSNDWIRLGPLSDRYEFAKSRLESLLAHSKYSQRRTQSQVQTVCGWPKPPLCPKLSKTRYIASSASATTN